MRMLKRIFQRTYKPTENFQRWGEIIGQVNSYRSEVEQAMLNQPIDFNEMFKLAVHIPAGIETEIAIFASDLSIQRRVSRQVDFSTSNTNHYSILLNFAEREIVRIRNDAYGLKNLPLEAVA